ncbi:MAG: TPR end-of-group domain-containing protein, partial [Candidatus Brocadiales bacterium]
HSLLGHLDAAFNALERAVSLGYKDLGHLQRDRDLDNLRKDVRYQELLDRAKKSVDSMQE